MRPVLRVTIRLAYGRDVAQRRRLMLLTVASAVSAVVLLAVLGAVHTVQQEGVRFDARRIQLAAAGSGSGLDVKGGYDTWRGEQFPVIWLRPSSGPVPLPPGMTVRPASGGWYISPALAALTRREPALAERFPRARVLGDAGVLNPGELLAYRFLPADGDLGQYASRVRGFGGGGGIGYPIGDATELNVPPIALAAAGLVGVPLLLLLLAALTISSPIRVQRMLTLHALGMPRGQRRRLIAYETLLTTTPGVLGGALIWTLAGRNLATLPLVDRPVTRGELVPPPLSTAAAAVGLITAVVLLSLLVLDGRRRFRVSPRPLVGSQTLRQARWLPLAAGAVLLVSSLARNGKGAALPALAGVLLTTCGLPLVLPILARAVGAAVARTGGPGQLLAGRGLQRAPLTAVRPLFGLAAILVVTPVVATWLAIARQHDPPTVPDQQLQVARITGALTSLEPTALRAAEPADIVMAVKEGAGGQQIFAGCTQLRRLLDTPACVGNTLTAAGNARLTRLVGGSGGFSLNASAAVAGRPDMILVLGQRSPSFETRIRAAALNQRAAVSVFSDEDLLQRESPLVAWILGGLKALCGLLFAALAVSLIGRSVGDPASRRLLGVLGLTGSQIRAVQLRGFLLAYGVVFCFALTAGISCSYAWHALSPTSPYPMTSILGLAATFVALGAVGVLALNTAQREIATRHSI